MANDLTRKSCRNLTKTILFNKDKIYSLYWDKKMSMKDIAKTFSCSRQLINKFSKELKINGISTSSRMTKSRHPRWKNGRSPSHKNGMLINMGNGKQKFEHVLIIEKILGRAIIKDEVVHHINGDKFDNKNSNLMVCNRAYHAWLHGKMSRLYMNEHFGKEM